MAVGLLDKIMEPFLGNTDEEDQKAKEAMEKATEQFAGLSIPEMKELDPALYAWVSNYKPELLKSLPHVTAQTITARPDVQYEDIQSAHASGAGDIAAERVNAHTADAALVDRSAMEGISTDPRLKQAQLAALASMQEIGSSGGMTATERAQLAKVQSEVAQADRGRREAVLQNMRVRGMGGSGMELMAQLQSSQAATDRASESGLNIAGMAQQRALQALNQAGGMAGGIRGQDFGEQSQIAAAMDAIAKFNAANTQQSNQFNAGQFSDTDRFNSSQALSAANTNKASNERLSMFNTGETNGMGRFNAANTLSTDLANRDYTTGVDQYNTDNDNDFTKYNHANDLNTLAANNEITNKAGYYNNNGVQGVANNNVGVENNAQAHNTYTLPSAGFDMAYKKAGGVAGSMANESAFYTQLGDREAQQDAAMLGGAVTVGAAAAKSDERTKNDTKDLGLDDIMDFLKKVKPKTYKYKPEHAEGDESTKVGFIMQDIEDTKVGKHIGREKDGMKAYDPQSLQGVMLAALKALAEKKEK